MSSFIHSFIEYLNLKVTKYNYCIFRVLLTLIMKYILLTIHKIHTQRDNTRRSILIKVATFDANAGGKVVAHHCVDFLVIFITAGLGNRQMNIEKKNKK